LLAAPPGDAIRFCTATYLAFEIVAHGAAIGEEVYIAF
jgi:hypothetical protein